MSYHTGPLFITISDFPPPSNSPLGIPSTSYGTSMFGISCLSFFSDPESSSVASSRRFGRAGSTALDRKSQYIAPAMSARPTTPPTTPPAIAPVWLLPEEGFEDSVVVAMEGAEVAEVAEVEAGAALADAEAVVLGLRVVSLPLTIQTPLPSVQHVEPLVPMPQHRLPSSQAVSSTSMPATLKPQGLGPAHRNTIYQPPFPSHDSSSLVQRKESMELDIPS